MSAALHRASTGRPKRWDTEWRKSGPAPVILPSSTSCKLEKDTHETSALPTRMQGTHTHSHKQQKKKEEERTPTTLESTITPTCTGTRKAKDTHRKKERKRGQRWPDHGPRYAAVAQRFALQRVCVVLHGCSLIRPRTGLEIDIIKDTPKRQRGKNGRETACTRTDERTRTHAHPPDRTTGISAASKFPSRLL